MRAADVVPIVLIGTAVATAAALIPARGTSHVPVLAALAGRRPLGRVPRWLGISGLAAVAGGLGVLALAVIGGTNRQGGENANVWAATAILGGVAVLLGACAIAPSIVNALERVAGRLGGTWRLAARSLGRQRTRSGAVVSSVCATGALAITAAGLVLGLTAYDDNNQFQRSTDVQMAPAVLVMREGNAIRVSTDAPTPVAPEFVAEVQTGLPGAARYDLTNLALPDGTATWRLENFNGAPGGGSTQKDPFFTPKGPGARSIALADDAATNAYGLDDRARRALESAGAVAFGETAGRATLVLTTANGNVSLPVTVLPATRYHIGQLPRLVLTSNTATRYGLTNAPGAVVLRMPKPLTNAQADGVFAVIDAHLDEAVATGAQNPKAAVPAVSAAGDGDAPSPFVVQAILSGIALAFTLFVVAVSLALASSETRDERDVLNVIGASPKTLRRTSARKAMLLTTMGGLLAVPVGFLPVVVFVQANANNDIWLVFPWRVVAILVLAIPAIAGLVTTCGSALSLRVRPIRASTMAWD